MGINYLKISDLLVQPNSRLRPPRHALIYLRGWYPGLLESLPLRGQRWFWLNRTKLPI